jgi:hypothetical protein
VGKPLDCPRTVNGTVIAIAIVVAANARYGTSNFGPVSTMDFP